MCDRVLGVRAGFVEEENARGEEEEEEGGFYQGRTGNWTGDLVRFYILPLTTCSRTGLSAALCI